MKTIKLLISCVIITIIGMLTLNGVKAATPTFSVESKEVTAGGEVEVKVNLSEDVTLITGNLELSFDKNKLEVKKIVQGAPVEDFKGSMDVTNVANANRNGYIRIVPAASSDKKLAKGTLLTITFKAKDGVTGSQALNFTVRELKADSEDGTSTKDIRNTVTSTNGKIDVKVASTPTPSPKPTVTASPNPTGTVTPNPTGTETPNPTGTATPNPTGTETPDPTGTATPNPTDTDKPNSTGTQTPNPTSTATPKPEETKKVPKTGDISVVMFIVIAVISLVGCIILIKKMN